MVRSGSGDGRKGVLIRFDPDEYRMLNEAAHESHVSMQQLVVDAVRQHLTSAGWPMVSVYTSASRVSASPTATYQSVPGQAAISYLSTPTVPLTDPAAARAAAEAIAKLSGKEP